MGFGQWKVGIGFFVPAQTIAGFRDLSQLWVVLFAGSSWALGWRTQSQSSSNPNPASAASVKTLQPRRFYIQKRGNQLKEALFRSLHSQMSESGGFWDQGSDVLGAVSWHSPELS